MKAAILLCVLAIAAQATALPGVNVGFDNEMINNAKDDILPKLIAKAVGATLPPLSFETGKWIFTQHYTLSNFKFSSLDVDAANSKLTVIGPNTGIVDIMGINLAGSFDYQLKGVLNENGNGNLSLESSTLQISYSIGRKGEAVDIQLLSVNSSVGKYNIGVSDGWVAKAATWLATHLQGLIKPVAEYALKKIGASTGNKFIEALLDGFPTEYAIPNSPLGIDYGFVADPVLDAEHFALSLKGAFYDAKDASADIPVDPAVEMPVFDLKGSQLQFYLSEFTLNTALYVLIKSGLSFAVTPDMIPAGVPFHLDTSQLDGIIPGFVDAYGANVPCKMTGEVIQPTGAVHFSKDTNNVDAGINIHLKFLVDAKDKEHTALDINANTDFGLGLSITNSTVFPVITHAVLSNLDIKATELKNLNSTLVEQNLNIMLTLIQAVAGEQLSKGIKLPAPEGIELTEDVIAFNEGYVGIETTPDFTGFADLLAERFWNNNSISLEKLQEA